MYTVSALQPALRFSGFSSWMRSKRLQLNAAKTEALWCTSIHQQHFIANSPLFAFFALFNWFCRQQCSRRFLRAPFTGTVQCSSQITRPIDCGPIQWSYKYERISPLLRVLYRRRVPERIRFGLTVFVFNCRHTIASAYFAKDLQWQPTDDLQRRLRSTSSHISRLCFSLDVRPRFQRHLTSTVKWLVRQRHFGIIFAGFEETKTRMFNQSFYGLIVFSYTYVWLFFDASLTTG